MADGRFRRSLVNRGTSVLRAERARNLSLKPCELGFDLERCPSESFQGYLAEVDALSQLIIGRDSLPWGIGFHASDLLESFQQISWIQKTYLRGNTIAIGDTKGLDWFCEWGAGLGGVSACASELGLNAFGFEVDAKLVQQARKLIEKYSMNVSILEGSFLPDDAQVRREVQSFRSLEISERSAWAQAPVVAEQVSLHYAYPWPGEESWIYQVFDQVARPGALLFCFHGAGEYSLWERVP